MLSIYKITSSQTNEVYVGITKGTLKKRLKYHRDDYKKWLNGTGDYKSSFHIMEYDDNKIELIEETNNSLREIYWIQKLNCCNFDYNTPNYWITKKINKKYRQGFIWEFAVKKYINKKRRLLINKYSTDLEYLRKFIRS